MATTAKAPAKPAAAPASPAAIQPFAIDDPLAGKVSLDVSDQYTNLHIGDATLHFMRDTGAFDGVSFPVAPEPEPSDEPTCVHGVVGGCHQPGCP